MAILFKNAAAVLMDEERTVLHGAFVAVEGTEITHVGTERPAGEFEREIDCTGKVLLPGFVNTHTHVPMVVMRGAGGGHDLQTWLNEDIFPAEKRWDDRAIHAATAWGLAEMIASGVTTITDMYSHADAVAQEIFASGVNANICNGGMFFGSESEFDPAKLKDCLEQEAITAAWAAGTDGQILVDASIHAEYTSNPAFWEWAADFARSHGQGMHLHLSETEKEHRECVERYGMTPAALMEKHGVFDVRTVAAHCVWTTPEDWEILRRHGVSAAHNPVSNLKLGSGIAPTAEMLRAGVNVCLGTDGMSSHNGVDFFEDIKLAAILPCGVHRDAMAMGPYDALKMATVNGARALGRSTGEIRVGKTADLILVDFDVPHNVPCHDEVENLVYASRGSDVRLTMARGKVLYENGEYRTIDLERVRAELLGYAMPLIYGK